MGIANFTALQSILTESSGNSIITFSAGNTVTIQGVTNAQLQGRDFLFAGQVAVTVYSPDGYTFDTLYDTDDNLLAGVNGLNAPISNLLTQIQAYGTSHNPNGLDAIFFNNASIRYSAIGSDLNSGGNGDGADTFVASVNNDFVNGLTGSDTVDYSHTPSANGGVNVDLSLIGQQNTSMGSGLTGSGLDSLFNIENLRGTSFNDHLIGNGSNNVLEGGPDNDTIDGGLGGGGVDTASYEHAASAVTVDLGLLGSPQNTGGAGTDVLFNISSLRGSDHDDTLYGNDLINDLTGGKGNDTMAGASGNDQFVFSKGDGFDTINDFVHGQDQIALDSLFDGPDDARF